MVSINIGAGQGVTQAIRDAIGAKNIKNKDLSSWQKVMAEVNNAQNKIDQHNASNPDDKQKSIFTGGNNVNEIGDKTKYTKNFVVQQGTIEIDDSTWSKIVQLLTGKAPEVKPQEDPKEPPAPLDGKPQKLGGGQLQQKFLIRLIRRPVFPEPQPKVWSINSAVKSLNVQLTEKNKILQL